MTVAEDKAGAFGLQRIIRRRGFLRVFGVKVPKLRPVSEAPAYAKIPYITHGYRVGYNFFQCVASFLMLHNETVSQPPLEMPGTCRFALTYLSARTVLATVEHLDALRGILLVPVSAVGPVLVPGLLAANHPGDSGHLHLHGSRAGKNLFEPPSCPATRPRTSHGKRS